MDKVDYAAVRTLIADRNREFRTEIRATLHGHGFRDLTETGSAAAVEKALAADRVDLLICDDGIDGIDVCDAVQRIRHHRLGQNPFVVTIVTVGHIDRDWVARLVESGADDLLIKPLSIHFLFSRIAALSSARRQFMVTSDYIGPSRPFIAGSGQTPRRLGVPNPVKARIEGGRELAELQQAIDHAVAEVNQHRMERHADQIDELVGNILPWLENPPIDPAVIPVLDRLAYAAEDIGRRLRGSDLGHVAKLCLTLLEVVTRMRKNPLDPEPRDVLLLPKLAQAIRRALSPDEAEAARIADDIARTIRRK